MELGIADDGECAGHEQAAQIAVPLFADTAEPGPPARPVLCGHKITGASAKRHAN
jgi:hypothetical protein